MKTIEIKITTDEKGQTTTDLQAENISLPELVGQLEILKMQLIARDTKENESPSKK